MWSQRTCHQQIKPTVHIDIDQLMSALINTLLKQELRNAENREAMSVNAFDEQNIAYLLNVLTEYDNKQKEKCQDDKTYDESNIAHLLDVLIEQDMKHRNQLCDKDKHNLKYVEHAILKNVLPKQDFDKKQKMRDKEEEAKHQVNQHSHHFFNH